MSLSSGILFPRRQFRPGTRPGATGLTATAFAAVLAALLASPCFGETHTTITVRVLRAKDGKPAKDVIIYLQYPNESGERTYHPAVASARTNADGIAMLNLPEPVPERISLSYATGNVFYACSPVEALPTADILKNGMVIPSHCPGSKVRYSDTPKPGELVVFGRLAKWWERIVE